MLTVRRGHGEHLRWNRPYRYSHADYIGEGGNFVSLSWLQFALLAERVLHRHRFVVLRRLRAHKYVAQTSRVLGVLRGLDYVDIRGVIVPCSLSINPPHDPPN